MKQWTFLNRWLTRILLLLALSMGLIGCTNFGKNISFGSDVSESGSFIFIREPYGMIVKRSAGFMIHPQTRLCFVWLNITIGNGNGSGLTRVPCENLKRDPRIAPYLTWLHEAPASRPTR